MSGRGLWRAALAGALLTGGVLAARAEVLVGYGLSSFDDLKYPHETFQHFDYVNPDAPKGGRIRTVPQSPGASFDSLNPFIVKGDAAEWVERLTFESLMTRAWDEPDAVYPLLARHAEYIPGRWVAFELHPDATFADGSPVTAEDVVFSFETLKEKASPGYAMPLKDVSSAEVLGPGRVKFTFREGAPARDLPLVVATIPILSKAYYTKHDFEATSLEPPLGSGPYKIEKTIDGRSIVYRRRADYWGWALPVNKGRWNFDEIVFDYYADPAASLQALFSGELDSREDYVSKSWATAYDVEAVTSGKIKREAIPDGRPAGTQGFWINSRRAPFNDVRVREALDLAFDFEWSNKTLFYGVYQRTTSFFENSPNAAAGEPTPGEKAILEPLKDKLPPEVFGPAYVPPVTDGSGANRANLKRAGELLDAAGWRAGEGGLRRNAKGEPLKVEIIDDNPAFERIINPYIQNLRKAGFDASLRLLDSAQLQRRQDAYDFDVIPTRFAMSPTPGPELAAFFSSEAADKPSGQNLSGIKDPAVDALLPLIAGVKSREELQSAVKALDRVLRAGHWWVPNWRKGSHTLAWRDVFGRPAVKPPYDRADLETWWLDPAKAPKP